ncbi:glycine N-acyltransferase-like protein 2 isoform X4 [Anthonomus grandis grandis]|nr:glycine N-acyltransferase-like protein 2 isoform X4 [Anthonomus grandis grandis]XP_050297233.1 glycine N-acyltransferase-like protein 2 isoform X4 [Anthonomus grandis grandis]
MEEVLPEGKNFRLVDESELPEIIEFLGNYLPDSLKFHQTLKTYLNDRVWDFHFYVTKTWPEQAVILHFPGMTRSPNNKLYESFSVFCPCDQLDSLELLESEDVLIDWTKPIYLNYTHARIIEKIEDFYGKIGTMEKLSGDIYGLIYGAEENLVLKDDENSSEQIVFTDQAEMLQLKKEHAQIIHDLYPANHMECIEIFEKLIEKLPCFGVFSAQGDLAAWMVQSYYGAMFSMQTRPEYRRKGYGIILAKHLTKLVSDRGYLPFVVIRPENDASRSLYSKLGFKKLFETYRAVLRPYEESRGGGEGGGGGGTCLNNFNCLEDLNSL